MNIREEYIAALEAQLEDLSAKIYQLEAKTRGELERAMQERTESLAQMKQARDAASEKLKEIRAASDDSWESLQAGAEQIWSDLKNKISQSAAAFSRRTRDKD